MARSVGLADLLTDSDRELLAKIAAQQAVPISELSSTARLLVHSDNGHTPAEALAGTLEFVNDPRLYQAIAASDPNTPQPSALTETAADLLAREISPARWAIPGLVPEGLSVLAGRPKFGKSFCAAQLCLSVAFGGRAFSQIQVEQGEALFLALEDTPRRLQSRLKMLLCGRSVPRELSLPTDRELWKRLDEGGAEQLDGWLRDHKSARLVVIDTWAKMRPRVPRGADPYQAGYEAAAIVKSIADAHQVAIQLIHHTKKPMAGTAEDFVDTVLGDSGLTSAADTILVLQRQRGKKDAVLYGTGRDTSPELEEGRALEWDDATGWSITGSAVEARLTAERKSVVKVLSESDVPLGPAEIAPLIGKERNSTKVLLFRMSNDQLLVANNGKYSLP